MVCRATFLLVLQLDFPLLKLAYRTLPISLCEGLVRDVQRDTWELETPGTCLLAYAPWIFKHYTCTLFGESPAPHMLIDYQQQRRWVCLFLMDSHGSKIEKDRSMKKKCMFSFQNRERRLFLVRIFCLREFSAASLLVPCAWLHTLEASLYREFHSIVSKNATSYKMQWNLNVTTTLNA